MDHLSPTKQFYYSFLGQLYAFAYTSRQRTFLGIPQSGWLRLGIFALFIAALIGRWGWVAILLTVLLWLIVSFVYWCARREDYNKFVADETAVSPPATIKPIAPNERTAVYASGRYAVSGKADTVLLQKPAHYWRVPLGDHIVMVEYRPKRFLYQFFAPRTLQKVQRGWILFGKEPIPTLAITFLEVWGQDEDSSLLYYVQGGAADDLNHLKPRTIYFSFEKTAVLQKVWATLILATENTEDQE
ncbi:hypothetical protein [Candidatus Leptofilum sp.]|uniref:hypothetical protein n=1 Tax=Candidatus Leptofilum sp. TaxID=3241576 RepID=UPI003B59ED6D